MLYAARHYSLPLLLAVSLHAAAVWALFQGFSPEREVLNFVQPQTVVANLVVLEAKPRVDPAAAARAREAQRLREAREQAARDKAAREKAAQEQAARDLAAREREEREAAAREQADAEAAQAKLDAEQAAAERLARLNELAASSLDDAIAEESAALASGSEETVVRSYHAGIYDLVRRNWSRPPSARTGMSARLQVELIPTGEVIAVTIVDSSGNSAFDRSAEQAVRRAGRFDVPPENSLFEKHFRRFYFLFQPEDLLR